MRGRELGMFIGGRADTRFWLRGVVRPQAVGQDTLLMDEIGLLLLFIIGSVEADPCKLGLQELEIFLYPRYSLLFTSLVVRS